MPSLQEAKRVLEIEAAAVRALAERLDAQFERAVELVLHCKGRVVVTGLGKSGAIGRKIASTFASTGTPSLFLHATEGLHGDLGMVASGDVLVAISYSGRTEEIINILPVVKDMGVPIIALTGNRESLLATSADVVLDIAVEREACPLNLAPTASTTAALAMGDALAIAVMQQRKFSHDDFARFHPGGALGKATAKVGDLMRTGARLATVRNDQSAKDVLFAITKAQAGAAIVVDTAGRLCGLVTDGDMRRHILREGVQVLEAPVTQVMTRTPVTTTPDRRAIEALRLMQERVIDDLPVVDEEGRPVGMLDVQELLRAGIL
jgi:arabinose-5-phosphate isomerase